MKTHLLKEWIVNNPTKDYSDYCKDTRTRFSIATRYKFYEFKRNQDLMKNESVAHRLLKIFETNQGSHELPYEKFCQKHGKFCTQILYDLARQKFTGVPESKGKFYAARNNTNGQTFTDWESCQEWMSKNPGAVCKSFRQFDEAKAFAITFPKSEATESKGKFYAARNNVNGQTFTDWKSCQAWISMNRGAKGKSFKTLEEARAFANITTKPEEAMKTTVTQSTGINPSEIDAWIRANPGKNAHAFYSQYGISPDRRQQSHFNNRRWMMIRKANQSEKVLMTTVEAKPATETPKVLTITPNMTNIQVVKAMAKHFNVEGRVLVSLDEKVASII